MKEVTVEAELDLAAAPAAEKGAMVVTEEVMGVAMAAELVEAKDAGGFRPSFAHNALACAKLNVSTVGIWCR